MALVKLCPKHHRNDTNAFLCSYPGCGLPVNHVLIETPESQQLNDEICPTEYIICSDNNCGHKNPPTATMCELCLVELNPAPRQPVTNHQGTTIEGIYLRFPFGTFPLNTYFNVGRDPEFSPIAQELALFDGVSRKHATFQVVGSIATVTDEGSTNKIFINERPCEPYKPQRLEIGDRISFGRRVQCEVTDREN